jgi:hypothetical protein
MAGQEPPQGATGLPAGASESTAEPGLMRRDTRFSSCLRAARRFSLTRRSRALTLLTVICVATSVAVLVVESSVPDADAWAGGHSGVSTLETSAPTSSPLDFPYNVSPALYPNPTYVPSNSNTSNVQVFDLSSSTSAFGMVNASTSGSVTTLWFESGLYSSPLSKEIYLNNCGGTCPTLPLSWTSPVRVATLSNPVRAEQASVAGSTLVVAATSAGSTQIYASSTLGSSWTTLGGSVSGTVTALSASPSEVLLETSAPGDVTLTSDSLSGSTIASVTKDVGGSNTVRSASATQVPTTSGYAEAAAFTIAGANQIDVTSSSNGGISFGSASSVGSFDVQGPNPLLDSIGDTVLTPRETVPGQVAMVATLSGLVLVYTSESQSGATELLSMFSSNIGATWSDPLQLGPVLGTIQNLTLTTSPTGLVYVTWLNPDAGSGEIDEATLTSTGYPIVPPTELPGVSEVGTEVPGAPSVAVDGFSRPLVVWPAGPGSESPGLYLSGGFLSANRSLALVQQIVGDPLVTSNFAPPANDATITSFIGDVSQNVSTVTSDLATGGLCNAQNTSVRSLYTELTHIPLSVAGASTVCASQLTSAGTTSPLVNDTGVEAPNTYLATYADWLLESLAVPVASSPLVNLTTTPIFSSSAPSGISGSASLLGSTERVSVNPSLYSPTSTELSVTTNSLPTSVSESGPVEPETFIRCVETGGSAEEYSYEGGSLSTTKVQVSVDSGSTTTVASGTSSYPSTVWLTHMTPDATHSYTIKFAATYTGFSGIYEPTCTSNGKTSNDWSGSMTASETGSLTSTLSFVTGGAFLNAGYISGSSNVSVSFSWGTTMPAIARGELLDTSNGSSVSASSAVYATSGSFGPWTEPLNKVFYASLDAQSRPGTTPGSQTPAYTEVSGLTSPAENATSTCQLDLSKPGFRVAGISPFGLVTNETATSALVEFWSNNTHVLGWVQIGGYVWKNVHGVTPSNGTGTLFAVEAQGLDPWSYYSFTYGVSYGSGCSSDSDTFDPSQLIETNASFVIWERDSPYDSITHMGGGAQLGWTVPEWFTSQSAPPSFTSGAVIYSDLSSGSGAAILPISTLPPTDPSGSNNYFLNLSLEGINDTYSFIVYLNYTGSGSNSTYAVGMATDVYEADTTGDGLTNLEKENGWTVSSTNDMGENSTETVTANPADFATNGLVSDYLEKLYGLNPNTVDTAGSQMLDTWNLTFKLGPGWNLPTADTYAFEVWNESGWYRPFSATVAYAPGKFEHNYPIDPAPYNGQDNETNLTASPRGGIYSGDGSAWASEILWNYSALEEFVQIPAVARAMWFDNYVVGGGLRAVLGMWNGTATVTICGKLSYGIDPLQASTPNDGLPDGARLDPAAVEDLELSQAFVTVVGLPTGDDGYGYALQMTVRNGTAVRFASELSNYSSPAIFGAAGATPNVVRGYSVALPVSQSYTNQTVQLQLVVNEAGPLIPIDLNGSKIELNVTYNMVNGSRVRFNVAGDQSAFGEVNGYLQAVPVGGKVPTWLWSPTTNGTTNGLPAGLMRFTGEQSFDLVVVNATQSGLDASVTLPWGGSSPLGLQAGLNNFLIPREQLLNSSFGRGILLGTPLPFPAGEANPPMILSGSSAQATLTNDFGGVTSLVYDLGAYWQNRSVASNSGNFSALAKPETGVTNGSSAAVTALASNCTLRDCAPSPQNNGGLPGGSRLYANASVPLPAAIQTIFAVNISSDTTLDLLLAALLDNSTDGINGSFQSVTSEVVSLGFDSSVVAALANAAIVGNGTYGSPPYETITQPSSNPWAEFWNAASIVLTTIGSAIVSLPGIFWSASESAVRYFDELGREAMQLGAQVEHRIASILVGLGKAILSNLNLFLAWLVTAIKRALGPVVQPVWNACVSYGQTLVNDLGSAYSDFTTDHYVPGGDSSRFWTDFGGPVFVAAVVIAVVAEVVITLVDGLSLGGGFVAPILLSLVVTTVMQAKEPFASPNVPNQAEFSSPSPAMIWAASVLVNNTAVNGTPASGTQASNYTNSWRTWADVFGWSWSLFSGTLAFGMIGSAFSDKSGILASVTSFVLAVVAILLSFVALTNHSWWLPYIILGVGMSSIFLDLYSLSTPGGRSPGWYALNIMSLIGDGAAFVITLVEYATES